MIKLGSVTTSTIDFDKITSVARNPKIENFFRLSKPSRRGRSETGEAIVSEQINPEILNSIRIKKCSSRTVFPKLSALQIRPRLAFGVGLAGTAMKFMMWNGAGKAHRVPLVANRFLNMMSELTIGLLLLEQAVIALEKVGDAGAADKPFYEGKRHAAIYFANNVLPLIAQQAAVLGGDDESALEISDEAFAAI